MRSNLLFQHIDSLNDDHAIQKRAECEYKVLRLFDTSLVPMLLISCASKKIEEPGDEADSTQGGLPQRPCTAEATVATSTCNWGQSEINFGSLGEILKLVKWSSKGIEHSFDQSLWAVVAKAA